MIFATLWSDMRRISVPENFFASRVWKIVAVLGFSGLLCLLAPSRLWAVASPSASKVPVLEAAKFDLLVYNDGDRVRGRLVEHSADSWLFMSERFGLLRVPVADATVIAGLPETLAAEARAKAAAARAKAEKAEEAENASFLRWSILSPVALTQGLKDFFGPWHGRFAFSTQIMSGTTETTNEMLEAHLQRKWDKDHLQLNSRYDFIDTNHVTTTDIIKGDASWRHDFPDQWFSIYSPSVEWNRAYVINAVPSNYMLLQQEFGAGYTVITLPKRSLRVGVAENLFDFWQTSAPESHTANTAESLFLEADWKLPWRMTLTERGVWYYSIATTASGWENKLELDKKLTETFTVGIRHEKRDNEPGVRVQDYSLLKFLMGIDF